jgi:gliding motility-associated lipoprotein GldH
VNHSNDLAFRNVYVKCKTTFPDNQVKEQVLSLELFDESGKPYGKCSSSECNTNIKLIYATRFPLPGTYQLSLEQYGRDSLLNGIESLGLLIEKEK